MMWVNHPRHKQHLKRSKTFNVSFFLRIIIGVIFRSITPSAWVVIIQKSQRSKCVCVCVCVCVRQCFRDGKNGGRQKPVRRINFSMPYCWHCYMTVFSCLTFDSNNCARIRGVENNGASTGGVQTCFRYSFLTCLLRTAPLARFHLLQNVNAARDSIHCPSKVALQMLKRRSGEQARVGTQELGPVTRCLLHLRNAHYVRCVGAALCLHAFFF